MIAKLEGGPFNGRVVDLKPGTTALPVTVPQIGGDPEHWDTPYYLTGQYVPAAPYRQTPPPKWEWQPPA